MTPSRDFVDTYIGFGADPVRVHSLLDAIGEQSRAAARGRRRVARAGQLYERAPQAVTGRTSPTDVRDHYLVERYDVEFWFGPLGEVSRVSSSVYLRATSLDVAYYYCGHSVDEQGGDPPQPEITALHGGALERLNPSTVGAFNMFFRLDRLLNPDDPEPHLLRYDVLLHDDHRADRSVEYVARRGVRSHTAAVNFEDPTIPLDVWWFASSDGFTSAFPSSSTRLDPTSTARFEHTFHGVVAGWSYGITWLWP